MGWKVHMLTKKGLCHNKEISHALNSSIRDTYYTGPFPINKHCISNSKVVLEPFPEKNVLNYRMKSRFISAPAHKSVVDVVRDWLGTGWSPSIFSWFKTIWLFYVPLNGQLRKKGFFLGSWWELLHHARGSS